MKELIISILLIILIIVGLSMGSATDKKCEILCKSKQALHHERINNGKFDLKDTCICYFKSEVFQLND